jgi:ZIP family zinc transporter
VLLSAIACAAFISTFAGGLLAYRLQDQLHLILGFSAGAVIGVVFFDLLPEALTVGGATAGPTATAACTAVGFLLYLVLDRSLPFHSGAPGAARRGSLSAAVLCAHSLLDGAAIGVAYRASPGIGLIVAIAVLTHDFSDGINTMNVVLKNGGERRAAFRWLLADALAPAAGIAAACLFRISDHAFGMVLALFAGFFLYIGASDLIPESYHAHPKFLTTAMTLTGAAALYLATRLLG